MERPQKTPTSPLNVIKLFQHESEADIIMSRLSSVIDILSECEEDQTLDLVHQKVIEAIDWYQRYCDENGYEIPK